MTEKVADRVQAEYGIKVDYSVGTMIEFPRACATADKIAQHANFFSFGTNDLTQTTFGFSRDDAERKFFAAYIDKKIMPVSPFEVLDQEGVGALMRMAVEKARSAKPNIKLGICGEHGGEPSSVEFCYTLGLNYVSCSPKRIPVARHASAISTLRHGARAKKSVKKVAAAPKKKVVAKKKAKAKRR
jgi:pyruvate,orthophosphate dikinase